MGTSTVSVIYDPNKHATGIAVNQGGATSTTLAVAQLDKRHKVDAMLLTLSTDGTIQFFSAGNAITGPMDIGAKGGFSFADLGALIQTNPSEDLILTTTGGAARGVVRVVTE
jgi:hypothetical protein